MGHGCWRRDRNHPWVKRFLVYTRSRRAYSLTFQDTNRVLGSLSTQMSGPNGPRYPFFHCSCSYGIQLQWMISIFLLQLFVQTRTGKIRANYPKSDFESGIALIGCVALLYQKPVLLSRYGPVLHIGEIAPHHFELWDQNDFDDLYFNFSSTYRVVFSPNKYFNEFQQIFMVMSTRRCIPKRWGILKNSKEIPYLAQENFMSIKLEEFIRNFMNNFLTSHKPLIFSRVQQIWTIYEKFS